MGRCWALEIQGNGEKVSSVFFFFFFFFFFFLQLFFLRIFVDKIGYNFWGIGQRFGVFRHKG